MRRFLGALLLVGVAVMAAAGLLWRELDAPGPSTAETRVLVPRGSGIRDIGDLLQAGGVIADARLPVIAVLIDRFLERARPLQAGEYAIPAGASVRVVIEQLRDGRMVSRRLTVPEGLTVAQVLGLVAQTEGLEGAMPSPPPEGSLLPDTWFYRWGDGRSELVSRMRRAMDEAVADAWSQRAPDLPLADARALVTLASIVEKETGTSDERPLVAGVFVNRLRRQMRLQSDPTVIYAITAGSGPLDRALTRADLDRPHPYNTYQIAALPPGPIANPGRASLRAVSRPADTENLYFVADGTGGHAFAKTLEEHNRNVARWRRLQRERGGG